MHEQWSCLLPIFKYFYYLVNKFILESDAIINTTDIY